MKDYLLIESRDYFDSREAEKDLLLAGALAAAGHDTTLLLVQNAVLTARDRGDHGPLTEAVRSGVRVVCDDVSLRERGIDAASLAKCVEVAGVDVVVECLAGKTKTLWF